MHALILEDEFLVAAEIEDILRECGFNSFDLAPSPQVAFEAVSRRCPDLITSDVNLRPGNGIDTIMTMAKLIAVPVIFITGNVSDVTARMPNTTALPKPFTETILRKAVAKAMMSLDASSPGIVSTFGD